MNDGDAKMKPMIILPPKMMADKDIELLRANDICVVVAEDPAKVRFLDPIPAAGNRSKIEQAAISLSRKILHRETWQDRDYYKTFAGMYVDLLVKGTPLDPDGIEEEQSRRIFNQEKADELRRLAREEAKAERKAAKEAKAKAVPTK